jgi:hypothetical protein
MSIISKITTAAAVFAFGLLALGTLSSTSAVSPGSVTVAADEPWGRSASVAADEPWGKSASVTDDEPWG